MNDPADLRRRPTLEAAAGLIGARLVREGPTLAGRRVARIVEVEAYIGEDDLASHARFGQTARNAVMYGPAGRAYVYLVYGMYDCLNIVTEPEGQPAAVLVRAVEPIEGIEAMRTARLATWRGRHRSQAPDAAGAEAARLDRLPPARLASGPGLVAAALDIDRSLTGIDLLDPDAPLHLEGARDDEPRLIVAATPRVGIGYAGSPWTEVPWRFVAKGHPSVSGPPASRVP